MTGEQIIIRGLRRRVHMLEGHNQHFERCESGWCHPDANCDPAFDMGEPDAWPARPLPDELDNYEPHWPFK